MIDMQIMENPHAVPTTQLKQLGTHIHILDVVHNLLTQQTRLGTQMDTVSAQAVLDGLLPILQKQAGRHN